MERALSQSASQGWCRVEAPCRGRRLTRNVSGDGSACAGRIGRPGADRRYRLRHTRGVTEVRVIAVLVPFITSRIRAYKARITHGFRSPARVQPRQLANHIVRLLFRRRAVLGRSRRVGPEAFAELGGCADVRRLFRPHLRVGCAHLFWLDAPSFSCGDGWRRADGLDYREIAHFVRLHGRLARIRRRATFVRPLVHCGLRRWRGAHEPGCQCQQSRLDVLRAHHALSGAIKSPTLVRE